MYQYVSVCVSMYLVYFSLYQYVSVVNLFQCMSVRLSVYPYEPISVSTVSVPGMCQCVHVSQYVPVSDRTEYVHMSVCVSVYLVCVMAGEQRDIV